MAKTIGWAGLFSCGTLFLFVLSLASVKSQEEVVGCGGFVRTSKNIDVTRIQVALFSKKGGNLR